MILSKKIVASLKAGLNAVSPDCRQVSQWQSDSSAPLSSSQRVGLRLHLLLCAWCSRYGKQVRFLRTAAHEHTDECGTHPTPVLSTERREQMKQSLRETSE